MAKAFRGEAVIRLPRTSNNGDHGSLDPFRRMNLSQIVWPLSILPGVRGIDAPHVQIAARSRFSVGTDALGGTIHGDPAIPDGQFFAWLGQFQWARRLDVLDIQTLFRFR